MARTLFACGAIIAIFDHNPESAHRTAGSLEQSHGVGQALAVQANVPGAIGIKNTPVRAMIHAAASRLHVLRTGEMLYRLRTS